VEDDKLMIGDNQAFSSKGTVEQAVEKLLNKSDEEKLKFLLDRAKTAEREDQRDDDIGRDHGVRLFTRQKKQGLCRIFTTLFLLSLVYGVQLVALYNLNRAASSLDTNVIVKWLERGDWAFVGTSINVTDVRNLPGQVRTVVDGSEISVFDMTAYGFCLTRYGALNTFFNVSVGLTMIYLFLFFDLWFVIFDMPLTKNRPGEPHGVVMLLGTLWLVLMNSAVITWLGVISGFSVIANSADFYSVLFTSLQLFIILVIDDTVLPAVRFFVEEFGRLDEHGDFKEGVLMKLTHGSQYYKPGYGHSIAKILADKQEGMFVKSTAVFALVTMSTIIIAPAVATIVYAANTFKSCP